MKRILSILLCTAMIIALSSGCGGNAGETASGTPAGTSAGGPEKGYSGLPIVEEPTTITYWCSMSPMVVSYLTDMNDNMTWQLIESLTNVHVDFWGIAEGTAENFNLMIASKDWADIMIWGSNYYPGGSAKGVEDEIFMELTDVIDSYMPNYKALREADPDVFKQTRLPDGSVGAIHTISRGVEKPLTGPIVRKDWLDDLGIDPNSIETYDDYYEMLTKFKVEKGATKALHLFAYGAPMGNYLVAGYGVAGYSWPEQNKTPFYQVGGEIRYGYTQPEFKEYLSMLKKWYSEGLISSDFVSHMHPFVIGPEEVTDGSTGLWYHLSQIMEEHAKLAVEEGFESVAIRDAVKKPGDRTTLANYSASRVAGISLNISSTCTQIETVAKWSDFFFSDLGSLISSYGVEGETFEYDAKGNPVFTDLIIANEEMGMIVACNVYAIQTAINYLYEDRFYAGYSPAALAAGDIWLEALDMDKLAIIPDAVTMSAEDSATFSLLYSDISTYALESIPQFIMGTRPLDAFGDFVAEIKRIGIQQCIDCWQRAYDAYDAG